MTMCCPTESNLGFPPYLHASSALLRLAGPFFVRVVKDSEATQRARVLHEEMATWATLRRVSELLLQRQNLELTLEEACHLREAILRCPFDPDRAYIENLEFTERIQG
jgi:hypothetical protein